MKRGQIWWAELPEPSASEPGYKRPVVIIQADEFNVSRLSTVIVATITSNLRLADAPGNFNLTKVESGLPKDSVVNVSQLLTLDKSFLVEEVGQLRHAAIKQLEDSLLLVLGIG
ncbi:MAG TPA: type II toxin-antitoxin system PemK/MazF family toxin [Candidatus Saccharimonadales bacterium]|nr:type II toxin-antitoxin system PemK/MazF family toxin [Candidatus Saccharimonadales bacterium]